MSYRIYSKSHPEGVVKPERMLAEAITREVERNGVYRGNCSCCGKRIVVREAIDRLDMTAGDEHFLLYDGVRQ